MSEIGADKIGIDFDQMTKDLLMRWLDKKDFLSGRDKSTLFEVGCGCMKDVSTLYSLNKAVIKGQETEAAGLALKSEDGINTLVYGDKKIEFTELQMKEILSGMIDILERILPLGTVVDLKKEYLKDRMQINEVQNIRLVITHRFLYQEDDTAYFQYAGVIYPLGMFDGNMSIHFTPAMIEKVVHSGYSDIQDEAYVYMMKQELILEKAMHSYGFSTEEERNILQKRIESGRVTNGD